MPLHTHINLPAFTHTYAHSQAMHHGDTCKMNLLMTANRFPLTYTIRVGRTFQRPLGYKPAVKRPWRVRVSLRGLRLV